MNSFAYHLFHLGLSPIAESVAAEITCNISRKLRRNCFHPSMRSRQMWSNSHISSMRRVEFRSFLNLLYVHWFSNVLAWVINQLFLRSMFIQYIHPHLFCSCYFHLASRILIDLHSTRFDLHHISLSMFLRTLHFICTYTLLTYIRFHFSWPLKVRRVIDYFWFILQTIFD